MTISIQIWSDIACPWCFVGKQRLESALAMFNQQPNAPAVDIRWRAFELDPRPKAKSDVPYVERLAKKYGRSIAEAQQMLDTMSDAIVDAGGEADFGKIIPANTFDAHRLIQWAGDIAEGRTKQHQLTDAIMRAYLGQGADVASVAVLIELAVGVGLDAKEAAEIMDSDRYANVVRGDEQQAQQHGISGVPFFVIDRYGISGAQAPETLLKILNDVQQEVAAAEFDAVPDSARDCSPDGCKID